VEDADRKLKNPQEIDATPGPAVAQQDIVLILYADASQAAKDVQVVGKILELNEIDFPRTGLLLADGFERDCGIAVATTSVVE
jgi:hypothetical protein